MTMHCNRCDGTGFLNYDHLNEGSDEYNLLRMKLIITGTEDDYFEIALAVIDSEDPMYEDLSVCDCCGDGDYWYGEPGEHYSYDDKIGINGPYAYNGGHCECH